MKAQRKLAETETPDGGQMALFEHDGSYAIRVNGQGLMHSASAASELLLGKIGTEHLSGKGDARILIGGLGLGFTLRSVLEQAPASAIVHVSELVPAVVAWNREFLTSLNGALLDDPRVVVRIEDVCSLMSKSREKGFDAILLDIDNGPTAMVQVENGRLYDDTGIHTLTAALNPGGRAVIWSAGEDAAFARRLSRHRLTVDVVRAKSHAGARRSGIVLYVADKPISEMGAKG